MRLPLATAAGGGEANERVQLDHVWGDAMLVVVEVPKAGPICRLRTYAYFADLDQLSGVWRMTGTGSLRIFATAPSGTPVNPVWGPSRHTGSN